MTIKDELLALRDADGIIRVETVHTWAKANTDSLIHASVEWNQKIAAREYQYEQIRQLIRTTIVDISGNREYVSLTRDRIAGGGYRAIDDVLPVQDLHACMLQDAFNDLERLRLKYAHLTQLSNVWAAAQQAQQAHQQSGQAASRPARRGRRRRGDDDQPQPDL